LSKRITICPMGRVDETMIEHLREAVASRSGITCVVSPRMDTPEYAYNETRRQYNSKLVLEHLIRCCPSDSFRIIGVTHVDLYITILKYVFGLAQMNGRPAVISTFRLRPQYYDQQSNTGLLQIRLEKTALHELGHTLGLTHCRDRRCVMYSSTRIEDTDLKKPGFCPTCLELFRWHLK